MRYMTEPDNASGIYGFRAVLAAATPPAKPLAVTPPPAPLRKPVLKDEKEDFSYGLGEVLGNRIRRGNVDVDVEMLIGALRDAVAGKALRMTDQQAQAADRAFTAEARAKSQLPEEKLIEQNKKESEAFLARIRKKGGIRSQTVMLALGKTAEMLYQVIAEGAGPTPGTNDMVSVNYRGTLINGSEFDSSARRGPHPAKFSIRYGVLGWREALQRMKAGSKWELYLPSDLAYGDHRDPSGEIEPGSTLIFEIELVSTEPRQAAR